MKKYIQSYLHSFKVQKTFWTVFLIDFLFFGSMLAIFTKFGQYVQNQSLLLLGGRTTEQIQELLASSSPEQMLPFLTQLKSFLLLALTGFLLLTLLALFSFSLSQALIWNKLTNRKLNTKTYWRWNALHLALLLPLLLYGLLFTVIKLLSSGLFRFLLTLNPSFYLQHTAVMDGILLVLNNTISFILALLLITIVFLIHHTFVEKYKVWVSIGDGLHSVKMHWKAIWHMLLLMTATAVIITIILFPLKQFLSFYPFWTVVINMVISLLFLAWMRKYLLSIILQYDPHPLLP